MCFYIPGIQKLQIQMQTFTALEIGTKSTTIIEIPNGVCLITTLDGQQLKIFRKEATSPGI